MLLLGGITSLPELANTITASSSGVPDLAINNLLGRAAINIFLLAAVDAVVGRGAVTASVMRPGALMMCALCVILLVIVALAIVIGDVAVLGVGLWSMAIAALSLAFFGLAAGYDRRSPWTLDDVRRQKDGAPAGAGNRRPRRRKLRSRLPAVPKRGGPG